MNVSLTPKLEEFVRQKVASGLYNNASEVVREALRLLLERDGSSVRRPPAKAPDEKAVRSKLAGLRDRLRERGISAVSLFGSIVRGDATPDSDIDLLIDVRPDARFTLIDLVEVKAMLEEELGHGVDVITRDGLHPALKERVLREAKEVFA